MSDYDEKIEVVTRALIKLTELIDTRLRHFEPRYIKTIYWMGKNKSYVWIGMNVFDNFSEQTVKDYAYDIRKIFKDDTFFSDYPRLIFPLAFMVANAYIKDKPEIIDEDWPPSYRIEWDMFFDLGNETLRYKRKDMMMEMYKEMEKYLDELGGAAGNEPGAHDSV